MYSPTKKCYTQIKAVVHMYRVALCEDEISFAVSLENICRNILEKRMIEYELDLFNSSEAFIRAFSAENRRFDFMLLDIVMAAPNGIELARLIRQEDTEGAIVFVTASRDYALLGYDVQALHYLMKPVEMEILERLITSDYKGRFQNSYFVFETGTQKRRVPVKDIISLETVGRRVAVTLRSETVYYSGKLTQLLAALPREQLVRCHQAFALNIYNIRELNHSEAITINGNSIPVSRTFTKDVQRAFAKCLRDL